MWIKITRPTSIDGKTADVGAVLQAPDEIAQALIGLRKAEQVEPPAETPVEVADQPAAAVVETADRPKRKGK